MPKYSVLPTWPFLLFGVVEPIFQISAYILILGDPAKYFKDQALSSSSAFSSQEAQVLSVTLQLGNAFLILALITLLCTWTHHPDIARRFLFVLALGDFGHIYANYVALGDEYFWKPETWNAIIWAHVGISVFLNVNRWLTLAGLFGVVGGRKAASHKIMKRTK